jgi:hypothetical protein
MGTQGAEHGRRIGISKWAIAALVAALVVVGTMGLVLRGAAAQDRTADRTPPMSSQSR